jgi:DNA polymerase III subunit gamma/tau
MSYKALYLTYRPQTFEEVAGQKPIVRTLKNALSSGKMAHAYLFAGPRGTGKTSMARLFAKALDCEEGIGHQCNKCSNCLAVSEGTHPDVIEIDAASNNGVDQVRDLIEKVKYAPIKGRYKVYIIDEVHMMSASAFNALLKTLEEPPENVIFILCTTEPYKVLPTILSRCQRFDFSKLTDQEMSDKLIEVLKKEGSEYDDAGVKAIVSIADGGMRDAFSILDQVLAYSGNKFHQEDVFAIFGLASAQEKMDLLFSLVEGDVSAVIKKSEALLSAGIDIRRLVSDLIALLKDVLVFSRTNDDSLLSVVGKDEASSLASKIGVEQCNKMISTFVSAQNDFKNVSDVRSLFELSLLQLASEAKTTSSAQQMVKEGVSKPRAETIRSSVSKVTNQPEAITKPVVENVVKAPLESTEPENKTPSSKGENSFSEPPDFLFENEPEKPVETFASPTNETPAAHKTASSKIAKTDSGSETLDTSKILKPAIATTGDEYVLPDEEIIKIFVLSSKPERNELAKKWNRFDTLKGDIKLGNLATLLSEGHPFSVCQQAIILTYDFTKLKKKANIKANQTALSQLVSTVLGREVFVYGVDPSDRTRLIMAFNNLNQVGQLPVKADCVLNLPK